MFKNSIIVLACLLSSCNTPQDHNASIYQGKQHAAYADRKLWKEYLACYPLNEIAKQTCTSHLAHKYINSKINDSQYVKAFQFEAEKQGFKNFINNNGLPCKNITKGPNFKKSNKAYLVLCIPDNKYFMQFDYINNEWHLLKD